MRTDEGYILCICEKPQTAIYSSGCEMTSRISPSPGGNLPSIRSLTRHFYSCNLNAHIYSDSI